MWNRRRRRRGAAAHGRHLPKQRSKIPEAVGTEAEAQKNQQRNARDFRYPKSGFVTPIEYTLLYAMLAVPQVYPIPVMLDTIAQEDFREYMLVRPPDNARDGEAEEDIYSYAQLSALMNLAAERWPPPRTPAAGSEADADDHDDEGPRRSVPQVLCRAVLQTVVRHAEENELDREAEVQELLEPLSRLNEKKADNAAWSVVVPMYLGLGASSTS